MCPAWVSRGAFGCGCHLYTYSCVFRVYVLCVMCEWGESNDREVMQIDFPMGGQPWGTLDWELDDSNTVCGGPLCSKALVRSFFAWWPRVCGWSKLRNRWEPVTARYVTVSKRNRREPVTARIGNGQLGWRLWPETPWFKCIQEFQ